MYGSNFLNRQRRQLRYRRDSKARILKEGGQQALSHSPKDLIRIDFAIRRIDEGQYGLCTQCGSVIDEGRLQAIPETPFCTPCAKNTEVQ